MSPMTESQTSQMQQLLGLLMEDILSPMMSLLMELCLHAQMIKIQLPGLLKELQQTAPLQPQPPLVKTAFASFSAKSRQPLVTTAAPLWRTEL